MAKLINGSWSDWSNLVEGYLTQRGLSLENGDLTLPTVHELHDWWEQGIKPYDAAKKIIVKNL